MTDPGEIDGVGHGIGRFHDRESAKTSAGRNFETTDTTRPGLDFSWNLHNLPCEVSDSSGTMLMRYTYLSDGTKAVKPSEDSQLSPDFPFVPIVPRVQDNNYRLAGKEEYVFGNGDSSLLDFGARYYDPWSCQWTAVDPLAEKYSGMSPYGYCAGDPVNLVDPYGKDIYTMDANGSVILYQETDDNYDCVYAEWGEGPLDPNATHVKLNDKSILPSLVQGNNPSINCSRSDMKELFKFAANTFDGQEWGLYHNKDSYELTTDGKGTSVGTSLEGVTWKAHSHPNVPADDKSEMDSMGYWTYDDSAYDSNGKLINHNAQWYESPFTDNDATQFINGTVVTSFVYFPVSGNTYKLTKNRLPYKTTIK